MSAPLVFTRHPFDALNACSGQAFHLSRLLPFAFASLREICLLFFFVCGREYFAQRLVYLCKRLSYRASLAKEVWINEDRNKKYWIPKPNEALHSDSVATDQKNYSDRSFRTLYLFWSTRIT
jgi:hypothetical protein